jgi:YHS domain-containing protein
LTIAIFFDSLYLTCNKKYENDGGEYMAKDPVCSMNVDEKKAAGTSVYKGTTYYFCAKICKEKFDKDPEKILTKEKQ